MAAETAPSWVDQADAFLGTWFDRLAGAGVIGKTGPVNQGTPPYAPSPSTPAPYQEPAPIQAVSSALDGLFGANSTKTLVNIGIVVGIVTVGIYAIKKLG